MKVGEILLLSLYVALCVYLLTLLNQAAGVWADFTGMKKQYNTSSFKAVTLMKSKC